MGARVKKQKPDPLWAEKVEYTAHPAAWAYCLSKVAAHLASPRPDPAKMCTYMVERWDQAQRTGLLGETAQLYAYIRYRQSMADGYGNPRMGDRQAASLWDRLTA
jgi:hypothetical protein